MPKRGPRVATLARAVTVGVVSVVLLAVIGAGAAHPPLPGLPTTPSTIRTAQGSTVVTISVGEAYAFSPNIVSNLPLNTTIEFDLMTVQPSGHYFTLVNASNEGYDIATGLGGGNPGSVTPTQLDNFFKKHPPTVSVAFGTNPGDQVFINITSLPKGWYEFVCTVAGHFQGGMFGYLAFGMAVPGNLSGGGPTNAVGLPVYIIVGTIVTLVVIAMVLGFVIGRRRQGEEMPPERLGYPEPAPPSAPETPAGGPRGPAP